MTKLQLLTRLPSLLRITPCYPPCLVPPAFRALASHATDFPFEHHSPSATILPPWSVPMVESRGDYRAEAFLEQDIGGPLYQVQDKLPPLPVPDTVEETLEKMIPSALPLAESPLEEKQFLEACRIFPQQAQKLQQRLQTRRDELQNTSWLQHWWNTIGYLQVRDPSVMNVSYWYRLDPDASTSNGFTQMQRAAAAITALAESRRDICSGLEPYQTIKNVPLCSVSYKYLFHASRIPHPKQDGFRIYDPSRHTHCIVSCKGQFFAMDFCCDVTGDPLPLNVLEQRLQTCRDMAHETDGEIVELGWLTTLNRTDWANSREELLRLPKMEQALSILESGAFVVCLDEDASPRNRKEMCQLYWCGGVPGGENRWWDKSIQLSCTHNGLLGYLGEHSMANGMPAVQLCNHILDMSYDKIQARSKEEDAQGPQEAGGVRSVFGDVMPLLQSNDKIVDMVHKAKELHSREHVAQNDVDVEHFDGYGSNFIKQAGFSPDAFVQMAIQLATYRLFGKQCATYESAQVRSFLHGRTETTRSVSPASAEFVKIMGLNHKEVRESASDLNKKKLECLRKATEAHTWYIRSAVRGLGVDRHLFGLSMSLQQGETPPDLFSDPLFLRSKTWRVSTSHVPNAPGFGAVVPDGVGIAYSITPDYVTFSTTARKEHEYATRFGQLVREALWEMRGLAEITTEEEEARSKL